MNALLQDVALFAAGGAIVASYFGFIIAALVWLRRNAARYTEQAINPEPYSELRLCRDALSFPLSSRGASRSSLANSRHPDGAYRPEDGKGW
jgi:hypothetical protein